MGPDPKHFPEKLIDEKISKFSLQEGEILMVMVGGTIGNRQDNARWP